MNPNSPMSYYQVGSVTVSHDSTIVKGYKTEWVKTERAGKPRIGSVFTIDQANFYIVNEIVDDETIVLNKPFIMPNQNNTSYLIINNMLFDITVDDQITLEEILDSLQAYVDLAKDWAIKMDGAVEDNEYSSKYNSFISKDWAVKMDGDVEGGEYSSKFNAFLSKDWANKMDGVVADGEYSSKYYANQSSEHSDNSEAWSEVARDFVVGPNPPSDLDTPSDTNNAYHYYTLIKAITDGYVIFSGEFEPTAGNEYPTPPSDASAVWVIETDGYTYSTGILQNQEVSRGDWLVYYQWLDRFQIAFVSTDFSLPVASTTELGIVELATKTEAEAGTDTTRVLTALSSMQQLTSRISSATNGSRTNYAASEKSLSDVNTVATTAQSTADTANQTATTAKSTADSALSTANSKWTYQTASTARYGAVKLTSVYIGSSEELAATQKAVNEVYAIANAKFTAVEADHATLGLVKLATVSDGNIGTNTKLVMTSETTRKAFEFRLSHITNGTRKDLAASEYALGLLNSQIQAQIDDINVALDSKVDQGDLTGLYQVGDEQTFVGNWEQDSDADEALGQAIRRTAGSFPYVLNSYDIEHASGVDTDDYRATIKYSTLDEVLATQKEESPPKPKSNPKKKGK